MSYPFREVIELLRGIQSNTDSPITEDPTVPSVRGPGVWIPGITEADFLADQSAQEGRLDSLESLTADNTLAIESRTKWRGIWSESNLPYDAQDQVSDEGFLMIANKETSDRAAPQFIGSIEELVDTSEPVSTSLYTGLVQSGVEIVFTEPGYVDVLRMHAPRVAADTEYSYTVVWEHANGTTEAATYPNPALKEGDWVIIKVGSKLVTAGSRAVVVLTALSSSSSTVVSARWNYAGEDKSTNPAPGEWLRDKDKQIRMHRLDANNIDRTSALLNFIPGTTLRFEEFGTSANYREYLVNEFPTDETDYIEFNNVNKVSDGGDGNNLPNAVLTTLIAEIPIPLPTQYSNIPDYWLTNQPSWGTIRGYLKLGTGIPDYNDNAYGVSIQYQKVQSSDDWDFQSITGESVSGRGTSSTYTSTSHRVTWKTPGITPSYQVADADNLGTPIYYDEETVQSPFISMDLSSGVFTIVKDTTSTEFFIAAQIVRGTGAGLDTWGMYFEIYNPIAEQWETVPDSTRYFNFDAQDDNQIKHISYPVATNEIAAGTQFRIMQVTSDVSDTIGLISSKPFANSPESAGIIVSTRCSGYL